jgi:hypothetical protein
MLRDFMDDNSTLDKLMLENGFFKVQMPETNVHRQLIWKNEDQYLSTLSKKERYHVRSEILRYSNQFTTSIITHPSKEQCAHWFNLYKDVKQGSYKLNTFDLPESLFEEIATSPNWEALSLQLPVNGEMKEVAVVFNYKSGTTYNAMFIGIDRHVQSEFSIYRQALYQILKRANALNCIVVNYGFTASLEKRRLGAEAHATVAYMQSEDHFNASVIESMQVIKNQSIGVN